jgi:hypothetical protein
MEKLLYNLPIVLKNIIMNYFFEEEEDEDIYCEECLDQKRLYKECHKCEFFLCYDCYGRNNIREDLCDKCFEDDC